MTGSLVDSFFKARRKSDTSDFNRRLWCVCLVTWLIYPDFKIVLDLCFAESAGASKQVQPGQFDDRIATKFTERK